MIRFGDWLYIKIEKGKGNLKDSLFMYRLYDWIDDWIKYGVFRESGRESGYEGEGLEGGSRGLEIMSLVWISLR